jgi:tetracycline 7-halogenase / FADH2 O2-dependent halogenase
MPTTQQQSSEERSPVKSQDLSRVFDVAIVGGGIGGSLLASVLGRNGVDVLLIEGGGHPRFTIGESTVPETIIGLRNLSKRYDVPEIDFLSAHGKLVQNVSANCGVKRNFGFVYHREGERVKPEETTQGPTWGPPLGPDSHFFRQDVDAYLFQVALKYGVTGLTYTPIASVELGDDKVVLNSTGAQYSAKYLVDAGGIRSILSEQLGIRDADPAYRTRSRTIFSHFTGVQPFDDIIGPKRRHKMPSPFSQGTLHHLFEGGWAWVIPFDNYPRSTSQLCSVGISLDLDRYPPAQEDSPENEFWAHVARFPDFARQMQGAHAVRPFTSTRRNQFSSQRMVGHRWCLLPHASDFIDPLFSSGLAVTVLALNALGHRLITAVERDDFSTEHFEYVQTWTKKSFEFYDNLVASSYASFDSFELWNAWFRIFALCTLYGANGQMQALFDYDRTRNVLSFDALETQPYRGLQGLDNTQCLTMVETACDAMSKYKNKEISADSACAQVYGAIARSGLTPSSWKTLDPSARCPTGTFTLQAMTRILLWGRYSSPDHVRGRYFTGGFGPVVKEAGQFLGSTLKRSARESGHSMRDMFVSNNNDWRRQQL